MNLLEQRDHIGRLAVKTRMDPIPVGPFVERWPAETPIDAIRSRAHYANCDVKIDRGTMQWILLRLEVVA